MSDLITFLDFAMDIVCMMPPLNDLDTITFTRDQAIFVSLGAIGFLVLAIAISALKDAFPEHPGIATVIAACFVGLCFIGIKQEMLKGIFLALYPPMVISLRFAEGAVVGGKTLHHLRWWHSLFFALFIIALYYLVKTLSIEKLIFVKSGWAIFGTILAAFIWTRILADSPIIQGPFSIIAIFLVFASTLVYVSVSPLEGSFYRWALPVGLVVGIIFGKVSPRDIDSAIDSEPDTKKT